MGPKIEAINLLSSDDEHLPSPSRIEDWSAPHAKRRRLSPEITEPTLPRPRYSPAKDQLPRFQGPQLFVTSRQIIESLGDNDDPIEFTSSLRQPLSQVEANIDQNGGIDVDENPLSDDSLPELFSKRKTSTVPSTGLSDQTAALLASIRNKSARSKAPASNAAPRKRPPASESNCRVRDEEKEQAKKARMIERENAKEQRAKKRETEEEQRRERRAEREKQNKETAARNNANKADKIKKEVSTPEMILVLPESFLGTDYDFGIREHCRRLKVDVTSYESPVPNVIKWRRKTKARWNSEREFWEPLPEMVITDEPHILCLLSAPAFVSLATASDSDTETLDSHISRLRSAYTNPKIVYMIEGLHGHLNKSKNAENRAYQAQVRAQGSNTNGTTEKTTSKAGKRKEVVPIDAAAVEAALLRLQLHHKCLVHHTEKSKDSANTVQWIINFTQHISTVPYRYVLLFPFPFLFPFTLLLTTST